jgi:large subunit ribosomal protein L23
MSNVDIHNILIRPVVSEKSYGLMDSRVYTFEVEPHATKVEIAQAVHRMFDVRVRKVNTLIRKGEMKRNRRTGKTSRSSDRKIAYVTLAEGNSIEIMQR